MSLFVFFKFWHLSFYQAGQLDCLACYHFSNIVLSQLAKNLPWSSVFWVNLLNFNPLHEGSCNFLLLQSKKFWGTVLSSNFALIWLRIMAISEIVSETSFAVRAFELKTGGHQLGLINFQHDSFKSDEIVNHVGLNVVYVWLWVVFDNKIHLFRSLLQCFNYISVKN